MPKLNPALFEPLTRIENAARRAVGIMLTAPSLSPKENELVAKEIRESVPRSKRSRPRLKLGKWPTLKMAGLDRMAVRPRSLKVLRDSFSSRLPLTTSDFVQAIGDQIE